MNLQALAAMDDCEQATGQTFEQHRTTYVRRNGNIVNKETGEPIEVGSAIKHTVAMSDIKSFKSPLDFKTVISSRSQLREYEKRHGVKQVGSDFNFKER